MKKNKKLLSKLSGDWTVAEISICYKPGKYDYPAITSSEESYRLIKKLWCEETLSLQEKFMAVYLNTVNKVIGYRWISVGTMKATVVDIKLLVSLALHSMASSVIIAHNHPSGNLQASSQDRAITDKIKGALELIDVKLLDHLIVTEDGYSSFADEGFL